VFVAPTQQPSIVQGTTTGRRSCIRGLHSRRFRNRRAHYRRKLGACLSGRCKRKYRGKLLRLYRSRLTKLRSRLHGCSRRSHRKMLRRWIHSVRSSMRHYRNIRRRHQVERLRKSLLACGNNQACIAPLMVQIREISKKLDLAQREYLRLKKRLSRCQVGLTGRSCRNRILNRFRRILHAKETALLREQRIIARAKYSRAVLACERNEAGNPTAMSSCVQGARQAFSDRVQTLRLRQLQTDRRHALRVCETLADPMSCKTMVNVQFEQDKQIAIADASASANALLQQMITTTKTN